MLLELLGGECKHCGITQKLQFDHINPASKIFDVSQRLDWKIDILLPEAQKCQLLCAHCHGVKTRKYSAYRKTGSKSVLTVG